MKLLPQVVKAGNDATPESRPVSALKRPRDRREYYRRWRRKHCLTTNQRDRRKERCRRWYAKNREYCREYRRRYAAEHYEQLREYGRRYNASHREHKCDYQRRNRAKNPRPHRESSRRWACQHRERVREYQREYHRRWAAKHPLMVKCVWCRKLEKVTPGKGRVYGSRACVQNHRRNDYLGFLRGVIQRRVGQLKQRGLSLEVSL